MATIIDRAKAIFRYRVGKFDSTTLDQQLGIYAMSKSGVVVTERMALTLSTVYACVYKISSTMASMSLDLPEHLFCRPGRALSHWQSPIFFTQGVPSSSIMVLASVLRFFT